MGANWCCHCGYVLPFGRKNARKCTECNITCHANCAHLVPDFCGISMETANSLLTRAKEIKSQVQNKQQRQQHHPAPTHTPSQSLDGQINKLQISPTIEQGGLPLASNPPPLDPRHYQQPEQGAPMHGPGQYGQQPPRPLPGGRVNPPSAYPPPESTISSIPEYGYNVRILSHR